MSTRSRSLVVTSARRRRGSAGSRSAPTSSTSSARSARGRTSISPSWWCRPSERRVRPAIEVADIFRRHGEDFRAAQGDRLTGAQRRVMAAIEACRPAALGGHVEQCEQCRETRVAYTSCRNRHCPKCQGLARLQWLADRRAELLPVPYFHVVFTVPALVAAIALQNKAVVYDILFKAAAETIRTIGADPKHLGAETGMIAILHTWGQTLTHHPHVHCIVPGGGIG